MTIPILGIILICIGSLGLLIVWASKASNLPDEEEWVQVEYKDIYIPMRAWQKEFEWDLMSGEEKRKVYLTQLKMLEKGEVKKVMQPDGKCLLVTTKKSSEVKKEALNYDKYKKNV